MDWDTFNDIGGTFSFPPEVPMKVHLNTTQTTKEITSEEEKNIRLYKNQQVRLNSFDFSSEVIGCEEEQTLVRFLNNTCKGKEVEDYMALETAMKDLNVDDKTVTSSRINSSVQGFAAPSDNRNIHEAPSYLQPDYCPPVPLLPKKCRKAKANIRKTSVTQAKTNYTNAARPYLPSGKYLYF